jgi:hypothetical protein
MLNGLMMLLLQALTYPTLQTLIFDVGNFLVFDLLQLGPVLPIPSPFA